LLRADRSYRCAASRDEQRTPGFGAPPDPLGLHAALRFRRNGRSRNWCCGGGGGVSTLERARDLRTKVFNVKKRQIDELNVETVVTACSNCRHTWEDGLEAYGKEGVELIGLTELVARYLVENETSSTG